MYCTNCGAEINDQAVLCIKCGCKIKNANIKAYSQPIRKFTSSAAEQVTNVYNDVKESAEGKANAGKLETNRSLFVYIVLSLLTCGIYSLFFIYSMARDVNTACEGDGGNTSGLLVFFLLSLVTCGIYPIIWEYSLANRLSENARRYNLYFSENGGTVLIWHLIGVLACGIGPFVAMNILIKNTNRIADAYNVANNLY